MARWRRSNGVLAVGVGIYFRNSVRISAPRRRRSGGSHNGFAAPVPKRQRTGRHHHESFWISASGDRGPGMVRQHRGSAQFCHRSRVFHGGFYPPAPGSRVQRAVVRRMSLSAGVGRLGRIHSGGTRPRRSHPQSAPHPGRGQHVARRCADAGRNGNLPRRACGRATGMPAHVPWLSALGMPEGGSRADRVHQFIADLRSHQRRVCRWRQLHRTAPADCAVRTGDG